MDLSQRESESKSQAFRHLLLLGVFLAVGFGCSRSFRFTIPLLNYIFGVAVLCIPFLAVRPLWHLPRIPKLLGFILVSPLLLVSLLMIVGLVACDLNPSNKGCMRELENIQQNGYSVHLVLTAEEL
jgi:hypothetical protein